MPTKKNDLLELNYLKGDYITKYSTLKLFIVLWVQEIILSLFKLCFQSRKTIVLIDKINGHVIATCV